MLPRWASPIPGPPPPPEAEFTHQKLKRRTIEGLRTIGWRSSTYPEGLGGSDWPAASTCEHWYSGELSAVLLLECHAADGGATTVKMTNISRREPDPILFQVPPDYTIVEEKGEFTLKWGQQPH